MSVAATPMLSRPAPAGSLSTQRGPDSQVLPSQTTQGDQTDRITSPHSQTGSQSTQRGPDSQTFPSQTTQGDQTDRITSPHSQTGSQSTQRSPDSQTFPSQTTQGDQTDRVTSPHSQTGSTTRVTSEGEKSDIQTTKDSEETLVDTSRQTEMDSEDNEMSEVIRTQNEKVKVNRRLQDAQNWCTEPPETESTENDSLETDSIPMTYAKKTLHGNDSVKDKRDSAIDSSQKSTENGVNESENGVVNGHDNHTETQFDSEEMSEVIPFQDAGKIPLAPELGTQNTESMNEMSEVIERQDYHRSSEHNNKENMASGDLKLKDLASVGSKGKVLNGLDSNVGVSVENKETLINGDELNEEELMDTLDS